MSSIEENYVILDCDIGTDDAWALLILLKAEQLKNYKILGVSCVAGNTTCENAVTNTLRLLQSANRTDIPVFAGATEGINGKVESFYHGVDGFGDLNLTKPSDSTQLQKDHAVNAMYAFACKYPNKITFFLTGPVTNFALCLKMYSDFSDKVKEVHIMGGNIRGIGNISRTAEFNFYCDPESAKIVLNKLKCPITILPWEACMAQDDYSITTEWRLNVLGQTKENESVKLLNSVEDKVFQMNNSKFWTPCDAFLIAAYLFPHKMIKKQSVWHATVELNGKHTRGQMILDHTKKKNENVRIIDEIFVESFKEIALWTVTSSEFI